MIWLSDHGDMDVLLTPARFLHRTSMEISIHGPAVFHADYGRVHSPAVARSTRPLMLQITATTLQNLNQSDLL
jgi:hypothetical protein